MGTVRLGASLPIFIFVSMSHHLVGVATQLGRETGVLATLRLFCMLYLWPLRIGTGSSSMHRPVLNVRRCTFGSLISGGYGDMRRLDLFAFFLLIAGLVFAARLGDTATAATYYLGAVNGDDNNTGTSVGLRNTMDRLRTPSQAGLAVLEPFCKLCCGLAHSSNANEQRMCACSGSQEMRFR